MSLEVMSAVWRSTVQPLADRMVLLALADNANDGGYCHPGATYLSGKTGISRRGIFRSLANLEKAGILDRRQRTRDNGSRTSNAYRINVAELRQLARPRTKAEDDELAALFDDAPAASAEGDQDELDLDFPTDSGVGTQCHQVGTQAPGGRDTVSPPEPSPTPQEEQRSRRDADAPDPDSGSDDEIHDDARAAPRPDVEQLCERLADRIDANGCKRPTISKRWRDAARLLLDRDERPLDEALRLIDWCQADSFWQSNVLSIPKFREKYDQLRLRALRDGWKPHLPARERVSYTEAWR